MIRQEGFIVGLVHDRLFTTQKGKALLESFEPERVVLYDGAYVLPYESMRVDTFADHFDWGNSGLATKQLALAILLRMKYPAGAIRFMELVPGLVARFLSHLPSHNGFAIPIAALQDCIEKGSDMNKLFEVATIIEKNTTLGEVMNGPVKTPQGMAPKKRGRESKYPFAKMKVGDVFFLADRAAQKTLSASLPNAKRRLKMEFATRALTKELAAQYNIDFSKYKVGVWRTK